MLWTLSAWGAPKEKADGKAKRAGAFALALRPADGAGEADAPVLEAIIEKTKDQIAAADRDAKNKTKLRKAALDAQVQSFEEFVSQHPASPWTPSLRANLGKFYRQTGRYTLALEHWEAAWEENKHHQTGPAKRSADLALAFWTRLLASLGRYEKLEQLFTETAGREFDGGPLQQMYNRTKEAFVKMRQAPGVSYKCGTYALDQVARMLKGYDAQILLAVPSPATGFSVKMLADLSAQLELGLVPARRTGKGPLVTPSVVHWKQNHYAAILRQQDDWYEVADPTFGYKVWIHADVLEEEASGVFLVPANRLPASWTRLSADQASQIFGRGIANTFNDRDDQVCRNGCPPGCPPGMEAKDGCDDCQGSSVHPLGGMPVWRVSEPYINLWLHDEPLGYQPARGPAVSLRLASKQREEDWGVDEDIFSFGSSWHCGWISYVEALFDGTYHTVTSADVYLPEGGRSHFDFVDGEGRNYHNNYLLKAFSGGSGITKYELTMPNGTKFVYDFFRVNSAGIWSQVFLSEIVDPQGHKLIFTYNNDQYDPNTATVRLTSIKDGDDRLVTFEYNAGLAGRPNLISQVNDPFNRSAYFIYNTLGQLISITDVASLTGNFAYTSGRITSLVTPYGTTAFAHVDKADAPATGIDRHIAITDPTGAKQIFGYVQHCSWMSPYVGTQIPHVPAHTFDNVATNRNSFYWNRQQTIGLPANVNAFIDEHFRRARMRHWLGGDNHTEPQDMNTLALERAPSSDDGTTEGPKTWYDHPGKTIGNEYQGNQIMPSTVARVLPDGSTSYVQIQRNILGKPTSITSTYGTGMNPPTRTHSFTYSPDAIDLIEERGPNDQLLRSFTYNAFHQPLTFIEVVNGSTTYTTTFTYDATTRQVTSILRPDGITTTFSYDANRRLTQTAEHPVHRINSYTYQWNDLLYSHTDPRGLIRIFNWDNLQRLTHISFLDGTYIQHNYFRLDRSGTRDRMGNWTYFNYNAFRQLTSQVDPLNRTTSYTYCPCGALESVTNPLNQTTTFLYDAAGRRTRTLFPDGTKEDYTYDLLGQLTQTKDNSGNAVASYTYNNQGLLIALHNPSGQISSIGYDVDDHPTSVSTAGGPSVTQAFDRLGRLTSRSLAGGGSETFGYSALGLISATNALNQKTSYSYDLANRKINVTNAKNETTQFYFSMAGDLQTLDDAKNQTTSWTYDAEGRLTAKFESGAQVMSASYNVNGRMNWRLTPATGVTYFSYDAVGNLTAINYPNSPDVSYAYDALNRLVSMSDAFGATGFSYTSFGALAEENPPLANDAVNYYYDQNRRRSRLTQLKSDGSAWIQDYAYDSSWRLQSISSPAGSFTYNYSGASGLVSSIGLPTGGSISKAYDGLARLTSTSLGHSSGSTLNVHSYLYNNAHQRTRQSRSGNHVDYGYDAIGQLTSANGFEIGGLERRHEKLSYAYDAGGNLTQRWNDALNETLTLGSRNQLTGGSYSGPLTVAGMTAGAINSLSVNGQSGTVYGDSSFAVPNVSLSSSYTATAQGSAGNTATDTISVGAPGPISFSYDAKGNMMGDGSRSFVYDDENQLTRVTVSGAGWVDYTYDGLRRKRFRGEYNASGSLVKTTKYMYDGMQVIQERDASEQVVASYTRGLDLSGSLEGAGGIGGLLARTDSNGSAYYHSDGSGNITMLINASQQVLARYLYDPFGNLLGSSGPLADANPYRFSSKEWDAKAGLYYYGFRFYDPSLQRWINQDPLGENGGINLYAAFGNDPINSIDPLGLFDSHPAGGIHSEIIDQSLGKIFSRSRRTDLKDGSYFKDVADYGAYLSGDPYDVRYHFDDISTPKQLAANWKFVWIRMDDLAKRSAEAFCKRGKRTEYEPFLEEYGTLLHAVQDFYAHSDFVDNFTGIFDPYNSAHWFTRTGLTTSADGSERALTHGGHSSNAVGMHKDHPGRPGFGAARTSAIAATTQNWEVMRGMLVRRFEASSRQTSSRGVSQASFLEWFTGQKRK